MSIPLKILLNTGAVNFGQPTSPFTAVTTQTIASAGNWTIPAGYQFIIGDGTAAQLQISSNAANATPTWTQAAPNGYPGDTYSDGQSFRVHNSATTAITIQYFALN